MIVASSELKSLPTILFTEVGLSFNIVSDNMYQIFEHTADLGLQITAPDFATLLAEAGRGIFSLIIENIEDVQLLQQIEIQVSGSDQTYLFFDWLNELLYIFESQHLILSKFNVTVNEQGLSAQAYGEPFDSKRHQADHEVKAITYHDLSVEQTATEWQASVIVDI